MNEQMILIAAMWAEQNQDFMENFMNMIQEYQKVAQDAGVDPETLVATKACLTQVSSLFATLEVDNG